MLHGPKSTQRPAKGLRTETSLPEVILRRALHQERMGCDFGGSILRAPMCWISPARTDGSRSKSTARRITVAIGRSVTGRGTRGWRRKE